MCQTFYTRTQVPYEFLLERREWKAKRDHILFRDKYQCQHCGKKGTKEDPLHVHHTHYISGMDPWEYKDSELITLCSACHSDEHANNEIPVYELIDGKLCKKILTPCYRCNGAGRFPEFKHVHNGICFRCHGARYEQYIQISENYAKEHDIDLNEYESGFKKVSLNSIAQIKDILVQESRNGKLYAMINFQNGTHRPAFIDYSISPAKGDHIALDGLRVKKIPYGDSSEDALILKGNIERDDDIPF